VRRILAPYNRHLIFYLLSRRWGRRVLVLAHPTTVT